MGFFVVVFLSSFGITVVLASLDEFGNIPISIFFKNSLRIKDDPRATLTAGIKSPLLSHWSKSSVRLCKHRLLLLPLAVPSGGK